MNASHAWNVNWIKQNFTFFFNFAALVLQYWWICHHLAELCSSDCFVSTNVLFEYWVFCTTNSGLMTIVWCHKKEWYLVVLTWTNYTFVVIICCNITCIMYVVRIYIWVWVPWVAISWGNWWLWACTCSVFTAQKSHYLPASHHASHL